MGLCTQCYNRPVRDAGSVTYTSAIESAATLNTDQAPAAFTQRVLREAKPCRFTEAQRTVVLGSGAPWIRKIAQELFPRAIQVVDCFHVKQHLSDVAKAIYGSTSPKAQHWAQRRQEELDSGRLRDLLRALRSKPAAATKHTNVRSTFTATAYE
jgi:transposase